MALTRVEILEKRDKKVKAVFLDHAPVWLTNDHYRASKDSFFFNIIYCSPVHSWVDEHYRYDVFNDVLYHMGEKRVSEDSLLDIQAQDAYISTSDIGSVPNNPSNRMSP